jgi:hypothetical protein
VIFTRQPTCSLSSVPRNSNRPFPRESEPPFSDDEPNSNPLSVVTLSCSLATCPAGSATRAFSPALSARNAAAAASSSATAAVQTDLSVPVREGGWWYCARTVEGQQYAIRSRSAAAARRNTAAGRQTAGRCPARKCCLRQRDSRHGMAGSLYHRLDR